MERKAAFTTGSPLVWRVGTGIRQCARARASMSMTRRQALQVAGAALVSIPTGGKALAAMYAPEVKSTAYAPVGDGSRIETYMPQIRGGLDTLVELERTWDAKTAAYDGDTIRRALGTVGVGSPLFNIRKAFLKAWQLASELPTVEQEQVETMESEWNLVLDGISSIDFQAYSVSFTELLATKDSLFEQAHSSLKDTIAHYRVFLDTLQTAL